MKSGFALLIVAGCIAFSITSARAADQARVFITDSKSWEISGASGWKFGCLWWGHKRRRASANCRNH